VADLSACIEPASDGVSFSELPAWGSAGSGWTQLFGSFEKLGVSFEWHEFSTAETLDWGKSFHPESLEICLNLAGSGSIAVGKARAELSGHSAGFYYRGCTPLSARRGPNQRHQFLTIEYSLRFLESCFGARRERLHPVVRSALARKGDTSAVSNPSALTGAQLQLVHALRNPPVFSCARPIWYQSKALELAATFFFEGSGELFCERQQRVGQERVEKLIAILRENLACPPTLEQLGAQVGCSPFYLSRTFSKEVGMTLPQFMRKLRMERAAELLRGGRHNVTEAALEVGYSSLSHFSLAFHETFGVCPGLYPILPARNGRLIKTQ
jgi:AraC family transcriptional regulator